MNDPMSKYFQTLQDRREMEEYNAAVNLLREVESIIGFQRADLDGKSLGWIKRRTAAIKRAIRNIKPLSEVDFEPHTEPVILGDWLAKRKWRHSS